MNKYFFNRVYIDSDSYVTLPGPPVSGPADPGLSVPGPLAASTGRTMNWRSRNWRSRKCRSRNWRSRNWRYRKCPDTDSDSPLGVYRTHAAPSVVVRPTSSFAISNSYWDSCSEYSVSYMEFKAHHLGYYKEICISLRKTMFNVTPLT